MSHFFKTLIDFFKSEPQFYIVSGGVILNALCVWIASIYWKPLPDDKVNIYYWIGKKKFKFKTTRKELDTPEMEEKLERHMDMNEALLKQKYSGI